MTTVGCTCWTTHMPEEICLQLHCYCFMKKAEPWTPDYTLEDDTDYYGTRGAQPLLSNSPVEKEADQQGRSAVCTSCWLSLVYVAWSLIQINVYSQRSPGRQIEEWSATFQKAQWTCIIFLFWRHVTSNTTLLLLGKNQIKYCNYIHYKFIKEKISKVSFLEVILECFGWDTD